MHPQERVPAKTGMTDKQTNLRGSYPNHTPVDDGASIEQNPKGSSSSPNRRWGMNAFPAILLVESWLKSILVLKEKVEDQGKHSCDHPPSPHPDFGSGLTSKWKGIQSIIASSLSSLFDRGLIQPIDQANLTTCPNVTFTARDMGYSDITCFLGCAIETPKLDSLDSSAC